MNANILLLLLVFFYCLLSVFVVCVEAIIYLLSYNLHACTLKSLGNSWSNFYIHLDESNLIPFHFWCGEIVLKLEKVLKYFVQDCTSCGGENLIEVRGGKAVLYITLC